MNRAEQATVLAHRQDKGAVANRDLVANYRSTHCFAKPQPKTLDAFLSFLASLLAG